MIMEIKFPKIRILLLLSAFCFLLSVSSAQAARLFFDAKTQEFGVGQQFQIDLLLSAETEEINAVEGKIVFPKDILEPKEIRDGNTIVNFWIKRPNVKNGEIIFSGIIPGGYLGKKGLIFSIVFQSAREGEGSIEIRGTKALLNDGKGTEAPLIMPDFQFIISKQIPISQIAIPKAEDFDPPELFTPEIASDPDIFDGKYFLVFATQDKVAGVDHYEILETRSKRQAARDKGWERAESPYVLKDQKLRNYIYVKAVDKAENERIAVIEPRYPARWYEIWWAWAIILLSAVFAQIIWKIKIRKLFSV